MSNDEAFALLMAAYDSGIRHFDTAPLYSWGAAEEVLGAFAAGKTDLTIVTKAGIAPPSKAARLFAKAPGARSARPTFGQFKPGQVRRSLETSLKRLQVDQVGAFLLHEPAPADVTDALIAEIRQLKQSGKAAALGLATSAPHTADILQRFPDAFDIIQVPISGLATLGSHTGLPILHSVLGRRLRETASSIEADPGLARELGIAPGDIAALAHNLLRAALAEAGGGIVLFSSTRPQGIRTNAQLTPADPALLARIHDLLAARRPGRS